MVFQSDGPRRFGQRREGEICKVSQVGAIQGNALMQMWHRIADFISSTKAHPLLPRGGAGAGLRRNAGAGEFWHSRSAAALFSKFVRLVAAGVGGSNSRSFPGASSRRHSVAQSHRRSICGVSNGRGARPASSSRTSGLIIMLAGGLFTDLFSVESSMRITAGETKNYTEDSVADGAGGDRRDGQPGFDQVTAIPELGGCAAGRNHRA